MKFIDMTKAFSPEEITLQELKKDFLLFRAEDPENYSQFRDFREYTLVVIMDTINGRNDCEISGLTPREVSGIVEKLLKKYGYI